MLSKIMRIKTCNRYAKIAEKSPFKLHKTIGVFTLIMLGIGAIVGAVIALVSTLLVFLYGQPRIIFAMARDGFFQKRLAKIHPKYRTPYISTIISGVVIMFLAGICRIDSVAAFCNSGTLAAFMIVCLSVIILRYKQPDQPRKFRTPLVPLTPILGILVCGLLFFSLPKEALYTFVVWTAVGLVIYFSYGIKHTKYNGTS